MKSACAVMIAKSRLLAHEKRAVCEIQIERAIRKGESLLQEMRAGNQISKTVLRREGSGGRGPTRRWEDAKATSSSPIGMGQGSVRIMANAK